MLGMAQAAQLLHQNVVNRRVFEALGQRLLVELWVVPGPRNRADIDNSLNAVSSQDVKEIV